VRQESIAVSGDDLLPFPKTRSRTHAQCDSRRQMHYVIQTGGSMAVSASEMAKKTTTSVVNSGAVNTVTSMVSRGFSR